MLRSGVTRCVLVVCLLLVDLPASAPATEGSASCSATPAIANHWQPLKDKALAPGEVRLNGKPIKSLARASQLIFDGAVLELGSGTYRMPLVIPADDVAIIGRGHVIFDGAAAQGKATFVLQGDRTRIQNIECRNVAVRDRNGACVRLEGRDLTLRHVYFHSSQQGLLGGGNLGTVKVLDSRFENLGMAGRAHGIYVGGGDELKIVDSLFLASRDQGHEIKSRTASTTIRRSVVASLDGDDSRLIDISNGGRLTITDSVLAQGPASVNQDAIGFGLEGIRYQDNSITLRRNLILLERRGRDILLNTRPGARLMAADNLIVGARSALSGDRNRHHANREQAGIAPYPAVPARPCADND